MCSTGLPTWDCAPNTLLGCYDPGTGFGQYASLSACQAACSNTTSWDCWSTGCYDPGTGLGQYSSLSACQAACLSGQYVLCDSMTATGSQYQIVMEVYNSNTFIGYWITTASDGTVLATDSMGGTTHNIFNNNPMTGLPYDTITTCLSYGTGGMINTCCVTWIWNVGTGTWARMGSVTTIGEINSTDKKLIKIVDMLGREVDESDSEILFYIYDDGTVQKKYFIK